MQQQKQKQPSSSAILAIVRFRVFRKRKGQHHHHLLAGNGANIARGCREEGDRSSSLSLQWSTRCSTKYEIPAVPVPNADSDSIIGSSSGASSTDRLLLPLLLPDAAVANLVAVVVFNVAKAQLQQHGIGREESGAAGERSNSFNLEKGRRRRQTQTPGRRVK